jgi:hypothetical protein
MNKDFRLQVSFVDHPKTIKLNRSGMLLNLLKLWTWAAMNRPEGKLTDMNIEDIEIVSGWVGEENKFVERLVELRFLDVKKEFYILHDWAEHNPYVIHSKARSDKARKAANAMWEKKNKQSSEHASSSDQVELEDESGNAPSPSPNPTPLPSPSTNPNKGESEDSQDGDEKMTTKQKKESLFEKFWEDYGKKGNRKTASTAFLNLPFKDIDSIFEKLPKHLAQEQWVKNGGQYKPNATTFLNQRRWEDEIQETGSMPTQNNSGLSRTDKNKQLLGI